MRFTFADMAPTGPGTLAGRYLRQYWHPVYVSDELPVKRAKPVRIMGEDFTLFRGESGSAYMTASKCAHRNTALHTGWVVGENIRCLYHGWAYDGTGQCVQQPAEPQPFCDKIRIRGYPVEEYLGLIFAYLGDGDPPPLPRYEGMQESSSLRAYMTAADNCNWLNRFDNIGDVTHPYFAHPQIPLMNTETPPSMRVETRPHGFKFYGDYPDGFSQETYFHMPNATMFPGARGTSYNIGWLVPIDDDHCRVFGATEFPQIIADAHAGRDSMTQLGEAILRGEMTIDDIMDHPAAISIQDYVVLKGQGDPVTRIQERMGRCDAGVIAVRKLWEKELTAFDAGAPVRRWELEGA